jgi:hypothetical protein
VVSILAIARHAVWPTLQRRRTVLGTRHHQVGCQLAQRGQRAGIAELAELMHRLEAEERLR